MEYTDRATDIRPGEELDAARLEAFLKDSVSGLEGNLAVRQFPSGHSNLTYLVTVGETEMVLRRPPFGTKAKSAHDMGREYKILSALQPVFPYVPKPLAYTEDDAVMGCPFYVMERINGIILRKDIPAGMNLEPSQVRRLFERLAEVQFELHSLDYKKIGLGDFGKPEGYVERQVSGWSRRYRNARTPDAPDCEAVMEWLAAHMPPDSDRPGIIHNDFKFDNVVLAKDAPLKIIGVLDWEMATVGDPLMDLGSTLGYWVEKDDPPEAQLMRTLPTDADGAMTRKEMVACYEKLSGRAIDHFDFYHCFGLFRLAVIAQQIYYRYYHGQTSDERFKMLVFGVRMLEKAALRVIEASCR
ncbi:aminoglycoside phosphotransferase [Desulfonema ishimotonii]|uniref:Aminoglycoside phosphotransferase n=1 Tax=Desulfonema ishimotonii TaxID=45657 RepID=A0A401FQG1_9BACT|nr:phosphotransferase family protein [Desulfonema ishimotonii]GBC59207.1 aminoglycoside phosphotransferase [Desulfonema ishimotonii]